MKINMVQFLTIEEVDKRLLNQSLQAKLLYVVLVTSANKHSFDSVEYKDFKDFLNIRTDEHLEFSRSLYFLQGAGLITINDDKKGV